ncbi:hypothetical protein SOW02_08965 [Pectobacterium actinidiae]|uniref:hypothetical protein n=1 Tax=Pectobacterium actinidiae TaxID=1507808 RepID=UPI002A81C104|nr:hypothetical protein [Pectobacterium actinidiae]MDY4315077.1 hypothetical protein [Pectobacterium actinidiae]
MPHPSEPWHLAGIVPRCGSFDVHARYRATCDAFPTRHRFSPRPCGSLGGHVHLSTIFYAVEMKIVMSLRFLAEVGFRVLLFPQKFLQEYYDCISD